MKGKSLLHLAPPHQWVMRRLANTYEGKAPKKLLREDYERTEFTQEFSDVLLFLTRNNYAEILMGINKGVPMHFVMIYPEDEYDRTKK